ncbi:MAG: hypothetical protein GTO40_09775 [Deltaproteobacteria bacterium]|nr:hypothetical protein [Deltaproteobacteria bacterium]
MRTRLWHVLVFLIGITPPAEGQEKLSQTERAKLANDVKTVFATKCAKCHGPEGVRETKSPKGEFGSVLNLGKLSGDPEKIIRGNPDGSQLFILLIDDQMPFPETEQPLPDNEKELIRRWILAGAPTEDGNLPLVEYHCPATKRYDFDST